MEYETTRALAWISWAVALVFASVYGLVLVIHLWYAMNPHDYDCSRHGGIVQITANPALVSVYRSCADGYIL